SDLVELSGFQDLILQGANHYDRVSGRSPFDHLRVLEAFHVKPNRLPCLLNPLTFFKGSQMFYFVFLLINDSLNCAGRHSEFPRCLPDIAAGSVKGANMLPFPVIQLLPSASHPPHSSSFSPSSMHSPTVFPRISSQGSSSLVIICLHSWQIIFPLPPLDNEKSTRPEGREFLSNVYLHLF